MYMCMDVFEHECVQVCEWLCKYECVVGVSGCLHMSVHVMECTCDRSVHVLMVPKQLRQ